MELTTEQKAILNEEISNDPLAKGYASFLPDNPGKVLDLLNEKTEAKLGELLRADLTIWAVGTKMLGIIKDESEDKTSPLRDSALAILLVLQGASSGIDFRKQGNLDTLDEWVTENKLTEANKDLMLQMATYSTSRAEVLGLPYMTIDLFLSRS